MQDFLPDLFPSLDIVAQVRLARCSVSLPPVNPPFDFLESISDTPLLDSCLLVAFDSLIDKYSLQAYLSFNIVETSSCLGCPVNFTSESHGNLLYIATNPGSSSNLSTLVPLALEDVTTVNCYCPCDSSQKRNSIEVTRVSSFFLIGF